MRKTATLVLRMFIIAAMAMGLAALMGGSASAQEYNAQCQLASEDGTAQDLGCTVVADGDSCTLFVNGEEYDGMGACAAAAEGENYQWVGEAGIIQVLFDDAPEPTPTPTEEPATEEPATEEPATEEPATEEPVVEQPVELPSTGAGTSAATSGSTALLGVMSVLLMLAGGLIWQRREA